MSVHALTVEGYKIVEVTAVGPASNTVVTAGAVATLDLAVRPGVGVVVDILALKSVEGLPAGLALAGVSIVDANTVRLTVYNATTGSVTVTANSVTARLIAKAY